MSFKDNPIPKEIKEVLKKYRNNTNKSDIKVSIRWDSPASVIVRFRKERYFYDSDLHLMEVIKNKIEDVMDTYTFITLGVRKSGNKLYIYSDLTVEV